MNMLLWMNDPAGPLVNASPSKKSMKGMPPPIIPTRSSFSHCDLLRFLRQIGSSGCFLSCVMAMIIRKMARAAMPFFMNV